MGAPAFEFCAVDRPLGNSVGQLDKLLGPVGASVQGTEPGGVYTPLRVNCSALLIQGFVADFGPPSKIVTWLILQ